MRENKFLVVIGCDTRGEGYCDIIRLSIFRDYSDFDFEEHLEELGYHNFHYQVVSSIYHSGYGDTIEAKLIKKK